MGSRGGTTEAIGWESDLTDRVPRLRTCPEVPDGQEKPVDWRKKFGVSISICEIDGRDKEAFDWLCRSRSDSSTKSKGSVALVELVWDEESEVKDS